MGEWSFGQWIVCVMGFQKRYMLCIIVKNVNKLASSVDAIAISKIWSYQWLTDWLTHLLTDRGRCWRMLSHPKIYALLSLKFSGLKYASVKKMTNMRYVWMLCCSPEYSRESCPQAGHQRSQCSLAHAQMNHSNSLLWWRTSLPCIWPSSVFLWN